MGSDPRPAFYVPGLDRHQDLRAKFENEVRGVSGCRKCDASAIIRKYADRVRQREGTLRLQNG